MSQLNADLGERFVVLTLALESALQRESWEEAGALIAAREAALREAEGLTAVPAPWIARVQELEARIMTLLNERRESILKGMRHQALERVASHSYRASASPAVLDRVG